MLIGAGRMGSALIKGWISAKRFSAIHAVEPAPSAALKSLARKRAIVLHRRLPAALPSLSAVVLAIKPQVLKESDDLLRAVGKPGALVLSIAAGVGTPLLREKIGRKVPLVRAMPNTPGAIGRGISVLCASGRLSRSDRGLAEDLMAALGETLWLRDEALMDAVTAVSGSGPAYVFLLTEALAAAGRLQGLDGATADRLARATVAGAGALIATDPRPASDLRKEVTSPGGTTEAALRVLMAKDALSGLLQRAVHAATRRSRALGKAEAMSAEPAPALPGRGWAEVFSVFLYLGLTSFGGPVAHLGYFRREFVDRRRWLDETAYADVVALCQFLPGPASSQVGISLGLMRAGYLGAFAAWLGFTAPSALLMIAFAYGAPALRDVAGSAWLHGLQIVAVAVVAQAVIGMARVLCPDLPRAALALGAAALMLLAPAVLGQIVVITTGGLIGWVFLTPGKRLGDALSFHVARSSSVTALVLFVLFLGALPAAALMSGNQALALFDSFYRAGALVFGGGHVVLPLLQGSVVPPGWISNSDFLAGYGAAQAVPGPLFTFSAYLGTVMALPPNGWLGALICLLAIFLPSFLLVIGALPLWGELREAMWAQSALSGINAAVVGLLLAALYDPVWISAIFTFVDFAIALAAFLALVLRTPPILVVLAVAGLATAVA
jgi:chromate transporter